jgi:replicative DNA helicase
MRRLKNKHNIGLIIIDYLQLMSGTSEGRGSNREQEISNISRNLKGLAKELSVPIIALSQLSRAVEQRGTKDGGSRVPQLSDLRESGAIEQDADMVMFLYRPEYYDITTNADGENTKGLTEVKIAKHRNGILDTVKLKGLLHIQKFIGWDEDPYSGVGLPPGGWRPVDDSGNAGGEKLYIQTGSKMNDISDDEDPF